MELAMNLRGCPFCGSTDVVVMRLVGDGGATNSFHVRCASCEARGPERNSDGNAAADWNECNARD